MAWPDFTETAAILKCTGVWGGGGEGVCQGLGGVLVPKSSLACCKGPQPLVFCIETDRRACWCLVQGRATGSGLRWMRRRGGHSVAARQRARGDSLQAGGAAWSDKHPHPPLSETPYFYTSQDTTWKYYRILSNTKA